MFSNLTKKTGHGGTSAVCVRAAITGASCRLPGAGNLQEFWELMSSQRHGLRVSPPGRYEAIKATPKYIDSIKEIGHDWGGYIDGPEMFDPVVFGMSRIEASMADPQHRLLLEVVWEALENACVAPQSLAGSRTGVFVGLSSVDYAMFLAAFDPYGELVTPFSAPGVAHSIAANRISYLLDLRGPSVAADAACASSSYALHMALRSLEQGECDAAIVCGANMIMTPYITKGFKRARMLAKDGLVKCFDEKTDGYVRAEGAVAIVIAREDDAIARGSRIMGVISGSAVNHDGKTAGMFAPSRVSQVELIEAAQVAAGVDQSAIGFVEAHGTGTYMGDETELKALNSVFAGTRDTDGGSGPCYVGSVKANVGHLEAVSGLTGVLKAVMCLENCEIPGQANLNKPMGEANVEGSRVVVPGECVGWPRGTSVRRAGVSCLGFGGANSHIVIEEAPSPVERACERDRSVHVLKLSAKAPDQIAQMAGRLNDALALRPELALGDICYSANFGRADFEERAIILARSRDDLASSLSTLAQGETSDTITTGRAERGERKVGFVFSGDGGSCRGMGRGLYDSEPWFAASIDGAEKILRDLAGVSVHDFLFDTADGSAPDLDDPALARVCLFAIQVGLGRFISEFGGKPAFIVCGGVGVHAAAVLDGRLGFEEGVKLVFATEPDEPPGALEDALAGALEGGVEAVIEIGAPTEMVTCLCAAQAERDVVVTSCLSNGGDDCLQLAMTVGALYTLGVNIDWQAYDAPFQRRRLALPTYCFAREPFWFTDGASIPGTILDQSDGALSKSEAVRAEGLVAAGGAVSETAGVVEDVPVASRQELFDLVAQSVASATSMPVDDIGEDTRCTEVELDSIAGLELLLRLDKILGVMPDPEMFSDDMTFGAAVDALHELAKTPRLKRNAARLEAKSLPQANGAALNGAGRLNGSGGKAGGNSGDGVAQAAAFLDKIKSQLDPTDYLKSVRPDFTMALHETLLDVDFDTALGDHVSGTRFGVPVEAIDMLGGFGSTLFGHNHPALVAVLRDALAQNRPNFVQMSNRTAAGALGRELSARVKASTGRDYKAVLGSTGAEMVDAALKHVLFEWAQKRERFVARCRVENQSVPVVANKPPVMLAIEGSYHGKTLGAYALTWHAPGRDELGLQGPFEVVWLPRDDEARALEIFARYQFEVSTQDGAARFSRIAGLFVEPILGEGGMFPLKKAFAGTLRRLADDAGCPIVVDEIQAGMGRAGAFTSASLIDLRGDYYLFGKSLGGGLTKTTALLIDSERYVDGFGFAHTSTFGEDDHGAFVALRALALLDEDDIAARSRTAGDYLVKRLHDVMARYPGVLVDVRGCGLMVGIELASQSANTSQLIGGLSDQGLLGIFVTSHLLHRRGVRVGTALSRPSTLRFEPSAYISRADMDITADGVEAVCRIIDSGDAADLVRHLTQGYRMPGQTPFRVGDHGAAGGGSFVADPAVSSGDRRAVFLGHMIDADDIGLLDKSLLSLSVAERENLAERLVDPVLVKRVALLSSSGERINFELHSLPLTSRAIVNALREGRSARIVDQVNSAVERFADQGARVVGLGGLLSVITRNGLAVRNDFGDLKITTGNTYTVALAAEAVVATARKLDIDPSRARVGIIGAGGNIGSTLVHILAEHFTHLRLVGRRQSIARVERAADATYEAALQLLRAHGRQGSRGLASAIADSKVFSLLANGGCSLPGGAGLNGGGLGGAVSNGAGHNGSGLNGGGMSSGARLRQMMIEHYGEDPFLPVSTEIDALGDCSVIVTASNSIAPILNASNVGLATKVICDVSVPSDVDPQLVVERPDIAVIRGGVARAPENNSFTFDMIDLPENHLLACMTETALLGFSGKQGFDAIGDIHASGVRECYELGRKHGFGLGYFSLEKPFAVELE